MKLKEHEGRTRGSVINTGIGRSGHCLRVISTFMVNHVPFGFEKMILAIPHRKL